MHLLSQSKLHHDCTGPVPIHKNMLISIYQHTHHIGFTNILSLIKNCQFLTQIHFVLSSADLVKRQGLFLFEIQNSQYKFKQCESILLSNLHFAFRCCLNLLFIAYNFLYIGRPLYNRILKSFQKINAKCECLMVNFTLPDCAQLKKNRQVG